MLDEAEQRGAARVLPRKTDEVQRWHLRDPRLCTTPASETTPGRSIQEQSGRNPVAQITVAARACAPSANLMVASLVPVNRGFTTPPAAHTCFSGVPITRPPGPASGARAVISRSW